MQLSSGTEEKMIVYNNFEWDVRAAAASMAAQGVSFKEASTVFASDGVTISEDPETGLLRAVGPSARGRTLVVLHQQGPRIRIVGVTLPGAKSRAPESAAPPPVVAVPAAADASRATNGSRGTNGSRAAEPAGRVEGDSDPPPASSQSPTRGALSEQPPGGWTAEAYGIYWEAYSAAREAARQQGKSPREAQRIGKEAGERAAFGKAAEPAPKKSARSGTWRAAARGLKVG